MPDGFDVTSSKWYLDAIESGKPVWTEPYINAIDDLVIMSCAIPIYKDGSSTEIIGVLALDLDFSDLEIEMNKRVILETGYPVIINASGKTMTHKIKKNIGTEVSIKKLADAISKEDSGLVKI